MERDKMEFDTIAWTFIEKTDRGGTCEEGSSEHY